MSQIQSPDLEPLRDAAACLMAYLRESDKPSSNGVSHRERDVLEQAMIVLYGSDIWDEIYKKTEAVDNTLPY